MKKQCEYFGPMISAYQDGELSATEREEVKRHLEACA